MILKTRSTAPASPAARLASAWQRWRARGADQPSLAKLPAIAVAADRVEVLAGPTEYRNRLLDLIATAERRIVIAALYLQDDDGGREILEALYAARQARPQLEVSVFVDWHRARRGLIGKQRSPGNAALYRAMAERLGPGVDIFGVPVQRRELLGVLHLKGMIIDDCLLYSGASLNDVYLQRHERYRIDRYHLLHNAPLADCLAGLINGVLRGDPAVQRLDEAPQLKGSALRSAIASLRRRLAQSRYSFHEDALHPGQIAVTPLLGLGLRNNELNDAILRLIGQAQRQIVLFTPYFNLPGPLRRTLARRLRAGCQVTIVLGDKTANDFYIPPEEPFKAIGALPYLYEANLRRFCKAQQKAIAAGRLDVRLWKDGDNTYHLKGLLVDDDYALLTGNNLNPRAWRLDLENGLLIRDPQKLLLERHRAELERILAHCRRLAHFTELEDVDRYPAPAQRLIRRLARVRADRLVNHML